MQGCSILSKFKCRTFVAFATFFASGQSLAADTSLRGIRLELKPRICTLAGAEKQCETAVRAAWRAPQRESVCLVVVDRPDVKRCWENYSRGTHSVELTFDADVTFELRDPQLQDVLASKVLQVIREALEYRRKRRQPWNIMY